MGNDYDVVASLKYRVYDSNLQSRHGFVCCYGVQLWFRILAGWAADKPIRTDEAAFEPVKLRMSWWSCVWADDRAILTRYDADDDSAWLPSMLRFSCWGCIWADWSAVKPIRIEPVKLRMSWWWFGVVRQAESSSVLPSSSGRFFIFIWSFFILVWSFFIQSFF